MSDNSGYPTLDRTILSLCDHSGNWPAPYRDAGYNVIQVDLDHGQDVRLLEMPKEPIRSDSRRRSWRQTDERTSIE